MNDKKDREHGSGRGPMPEGNKPSKQSKTIYWIMGAIVVVAILSAIIFG